MKKLITKKWYRNYIKQRLRRQISIFILKPYSKVCYRAQYNYLAEPGKILNIDTDEITGWYRGNRYSEYTFEGQIKGGDWSRKISPRDQMLRESAKYNGIVQHFVYGLPWRDTDLFKESYKKKIDSDIKVKDFDNLTSLEKYYIETYDSLFENIKNNGIITYNHNDKKIDPIYININADGQILYTVDGNHRLFMCFILGIKKIRVKVWMRHENWQKKREMILSGNWRKRNDIDIELLNHPDIISEQGIVQENEA